MVLLIRGPKKSDKTDTKLKVWFEDKLGGGKSMRKLDGGAKVCFKKRFESVCLISLGYQQASYQQKS